MPDFNIIIADSCHELGDELSIFGELINGEHVLREQVLYKEAPSLEVLYRDLGIYKSSSEAKRAGKGGEIPLGYSEHKASKKRRVYIWNPSRYTKDYE